jgi:hypothetical protein
MTKDEKEWWKVISNSSRARHDFISKAIFLLFFYLMLYSEIMPFHPDRPELLRLPDRASSSSRTDHEDRHRLFTLHKHTFLFSSINEICLLQHGASISATFLLV